MTSVPERVHVFEMSDKNDPTLSVLILNKTGAIRKLVAYTVHLLSVSPAS